MLFVMVVSLYTSRVILETLGVVDYGLYNVVGGIVTILAFLNGALSAATSRFLTFELGSGDSEKLNNTFSASLNLHILIALLVVIIGESVGLWFFYNKMVIPADRLNAAMWVYQFSIVTTVLTFTQVPYNASLVSHENMSIYAYVGIYDALARLGIVYLIYISPIDKLVFYAALLLLNTSLVQLFYRFYTKRKYCECRFRLVKDMQLYKKLIGYCGWDLFGSVSTVCQGQGMNIVLNIFFGPAVNAVRAVVVQIQSAVDQFVRNFLTAVRPQVIKRSAEQNYKEMYQLSFMASKYAYTIMFAMIVPLCFEINFVLKLWLGENVPEYTNIFAVLVMITSLLQTFHAASLMPYHAIGKINKGNIIGGTILISSLPISYVLFRCGMPPYAGFIVILCTNTIQQFITWWVVYVYVKFDIDELIRKAYIPCIKLTFCGLILPCLIYHFLPDGFWRFLILLISFETSLVAIVYYVVLGEAERASIVGFIKKKKYV